MPPIEPVLFHFDADSVGTNAVFRPLEKPEIQYTELKILKAIVIQGSTGARCVGRDSFTN